MTKVLIVDDELSIRETFQAFLEEAGYDVTTAADFFEAESFLVRALPPAVGEPVEPPGGPGGVDVVVADIILPRVNGLALLQRVREIDEDVPVILITGEPDVSTAAEAVRHGAYDYVAKPVTQRVLNRVVGRAAERKRLLDEQRRLEAENRAYQANLEKKIAERTAELEQRNRELATLIEIGRDISATLNLTEVLKRVTQRVAQICGAHRCTVWLLEEDGKMLIPSMSQFSNGHVDREMWHLFQDAGYPVPVSQVAEAQQIIRERRPLFISDVSASSLPRHWIEPFGVKGVLVIPLISKGRVIGLAGLDHVEEGRGFTAGQVDLAMAIAAQAAIAIQNARLFEAEQRRAAEIEALAEVGRAVSSTLDLGQVLKAIATHATTLSHSDEGGIFEVDEVEDVLRISAGCNASEEFMRAVNKAKVGIGEGAIGRAVATREPVQVVDTETDAGYCFQEIAAIDNIRSVLAVPMFKGEELLGGVVLWRRRPGPFSSRDVALLTTMADHAAVAIQNARLYEEARRYVEELTALHTIDVTITSTLSLDEVLQRVYEQVSTVMDVATFHIALYDEERDELHLPIIVDQGKQLPPRTLRVGEENGLSGWVVRTQEPLWIGDMEKEQETLPVRAIAEGVPTRSLMVLPLIARDKVVGVISAQSCEPYAFDEDHRRLFSGIAAQVAIAVENARLYGETKRRAEEMTTLYHTSLEIGSPTDLPDLLWIICDRAAKLLDVDKGGLYLYDEAQGELELVVSYKLGRDFAGTRIKLGEGVAGRVVQTGQPLTVDDYSRWDGRARVYEREPFAAVIGVPLRWQEQIVGAITLSEETRRRTFTPDDERLLSLFAQQAALAVENARLFEETNRRLAETRLLQEVMQAAASTLDFDEVLTRTIETLHGTLGIDYLGFALPDDSGAALVTHPSMIGFTTPPEGFLRLPLEGSIIGRVYQTGEPLLVPDVEQVPYYFEIAPETRSELTVPVRVGDQIIAVLNAESAVPAAFDEDDLSLLSAVAAQLGVVLENTRLYRTSQEQADELSRAYDELKELDRLRTQLVQNVSHELRTPLSLIRGYVELLLQSDLGPILDSQRAALRVIGERTSTLVRLIHNLTMLQAVSREALGLAPVSVVGIVQRVLAEFRRPAKQANVSFQEELPAELPPVLGDRERLELVFGHLVDNAIKFSPGGSSVTIRAWADEAWVYVSIADEGIGIAPDHLDRIFERFYQVDGATTRRFGGMGVGLALVWEIIEAHNGTVEVESEPGEGSTFTVVLPQA